MSIRLEMLQVARLAPKLLGDSSALVSQFLTEQQCSNGGFPGRDGKSDLYYTVFALEGLMALQGPAPKISVGPFLTGFGAGEALDFVHLCCLIRCWAGVDPTRMPRDAFRVRLESFRSHDGGYHPVPGQDAGTAYAAFLAVAAHQDLGGLPPEPMRIVQSLKFLETPDGAWANERHVPIGSTNATAAAVTLLRQLGVPVNPAVGDWLLARRHDQGGFAAAPGAPLPDLLSTATTLHALAGLERDVSKWKEACLDFVDSLWTNQGAFHGHWAEDAVDSEYTYYGLLALGHLSL